MIISTDAEKASIQYRFKIKTPNKVGIEVTYLNIIQGMYDKPIHSNIVQSEKLKFFLYDEEKDKDAHSCHFYST